MLSNIRNEICPPLSDKQIENARIRFSPVLIMNYLWLICCVVLVYLLHIESNKGFDKAVIIISSAFIIYSFIPAIYKKIFFLLLTVLLEYYLLGFKIASGVTGLLLFFTGFTYIQNQKIRSIIIVAVTLLCMLAFSRIVLIPFLRPVLLFGAPFLMLRYIYLLYELNYFKVKPVFIDRLCYLFLLPNVCFPLFPILDPKDFLSGYLSFPFKEVMRNALANITVGITHLLIYRIIYLYFSPSPYEIENFGTYLLFIFSAYSFIFRLSGLFFISFGFLQLFGFKFPPVFDRFYFSTGFTDLWRRVNLYWRTFMMRVFYYPLVFKLKKFNPKSVLFFSTIIMFIITWFLHSWQWYWIKGSFYFYPADMLFWGILGLVISVNSVIEYGQTNRNSFYFKIINNYFFKGAQIVIVFIIISILWSLWTSSSLSEFMYLSGFALNASIKEYLIFFLFFFVVIVIAGILRFLHEKHSAFQFFFKEINYTTGILFSVALILTLLLLKNSRFSYEMGAFMDVNLNHKDKSMIERGYYEQLLNNDDKSIEMVNIGSKLKKWDLDNKAYQKVNNELLKEFMPEYVTIFKGDSLSTNSFGLRDKEYSLKKDSNTIRIAFLGGSYVMGSGVSNSENFEAITEKNLNEKNKGQKIEILNYGAGGYHLIQCAFIAEHKLTDKGIDYLFYFIHSSDKMRCLDNFVNVIQKGVPLTFDFINEIYRSAGIKKGMCRLEMYNRLKPFADKLIQKGYKVIRDKCIKLNIRPVAVYLPTQSNLRKDADKEFCLNEAKKLGFYTIDLFEVYEGYSPDEIQLAAWDTHPNEKGHQIIAKKLSEKIKKDSTYFNF